MSKAKILMVDDSAVILEASSMVLEDAGYEVITLENPLEVAGSVRRNKPDVILIDVNMPAVMGDVVTQIVKNHGMAQKTMVILYSDIPVSELEKRASSCGANGYIQKTGDESKLVSQLERIIQSGDKRVTG